MLKIFGQVNKDSKESKGAKPVENSFSSIAKAAPNSFSQVSKNNDLSNNIPQGPSIPSVYPYEMLSEANKKISADVNQYQTDHIVSNGRKKQKFVLGKSRRDRSSLEEEDNDIYTSEDTFSSTASTLIENSDVDALIDARHGKSRERFNTLSTPKTFDLGNYSDNKGKFFKFEISKFA